jgi:hypothetical protein
LSNYTPNRIDDPAEDEGITRGCLPGFLSEPLPLVIVIIVALSAFNRLAC